MTNFAYEDRSLSYDVPGSDVPMDLFQANGAWNVENYTSVKYVSCTMSLTGQSHILHFVCRIHCCKDGDA